MLRFLRFGGTSVLLLVALFALSLLSGCGSGGTPAAVSEGMTAADTDHARAMYQKLVKEHSLDRHDKVLPLAESLLAQYPDYPRNDEILLMAVEAAANLGEVPRAFALTDRMLESYPSSSHLVPVLRISADLARTGGDTMHAAAYAVPLYDRDPAGQTGPDGLPLAADVFVELTSDELGALVARYPSSVLRPYLDSLQANVLSPGAAAGANDVLVNQVGVICPLTGRYAVLGNAFYDAALLALKATNAQLDTKFELKLEDSQGDPVAAALAARRLCAEEGSVALMGAMMSDPTAAVAIIADQWQVPLVSPTATNERIWELGGGIFQTNLTGIYETRLLASLAATVMLKKRFGLLYPDTPEGRGHADVFRAEVEGLGGEIVAAEAFPSHSTDFKDSILALRRKRPEVLFVPASVDQMVLLGPQLDFYHAGSLIMGLSNWNSAKLRERSGTVLERAIFPNDLALFPEEWTAEFRDRWDGENYPPEASALALRSYQATRMLLDTMGRGQIDGRAALIEALRNRLASRGFEAEGPDSFTGKVRMFRSEEIVPFPGARFREAWMLNEGAAADTLAAEPFLDELEVPGD